MAKARFLRGVIGGGALLTLGWIQGAQGPKPKDSFKISPDTVYFNKVAGETTITRTVNLHRVGPPGAAISFTTSVSTDSGGNWLSVSPGAGTIPADLMLTASTGALGAGVYTGKVTVTPLGGNGSPQVLSAVLRVLTGFAGAPAAFVRPLALSFHMVQGGANPEPRLLSVSSPTGGASFPWTATPSAATWLSISPAQGTGPGLIVVTVDGSGLSPGRHSATITVAGGAASTQVRVTLEVRSPAQPQLVIDPRAFNFIVHPGGPVPAPKTLRVKNAGSGALDWTATAVSTGNWLSITPGAGTTPSTIELSVNPEGLARGHYAGTVEVTAGGRTETARVFLRILGPASVGPVPIVTPSAVQITPRAVEFCLCGGVLTPPSVNIQLTSKVDGLSFTATRMTAQGGDWLNINPTAGAIPGAITVTAAPGNLATGVYTGLISISITGAVTEQRIVPVTLRVSPQAEVPRLMVRPGAIAFRADLGGSPPAAQPVTLEARGAASLSYQATTSTTTGVNWLSVDPASGTAPRTVSVSVNIAGLGAGVYYGSVVFQATGTTGALPAVLGVFLQVLPSPTGAAFNARSAAALPSGLLGFFLEPPAEFFATANSPQAVRVKLLAADGKPVEGATVEVTPSSGEPPVTLGDAGSGIYTGMFPSLSAGPVNLTARAVTAAGVAATFGLGGDVDGGPDAPVIFQGGVVNAANYAPAPTPLAPGSLASLFGANLTESTLTASAFPLPRELAGVRVLVGSIEAPLVAVMTTDQGYDQVNFQAPVEVGALSYADVVVLSSGVFSAPEGIAIAPALPALFTLNRQGTGPAAALHADYTEITTERPARAGQTILLYATGLGEVSPAQQTGRPPTGLSRLVAGASVTIAGRAAKVEFAGLAPGYAGLYQLNVIVPQGTPAGDAAVDIIVDGINSGEGVVIPVR